MPILTVLLGTPADTDLARQVADDLLGLTAEHLGKRADLTSIVVQFVDPAHWFIGGQAAASGGRSTAFVEIRVTDETNTKAQKAHWIAAVHAALARRLGALHDTSYVQVQDVRAAAWGYGGRTQEARAHAPEPARAAAGGAGYRSGIGRLRSTDTAVTAFCGLPSITRSL